MTLLESYFQTIDGYAKKAKLDGKDEQKIGEKCNKAKEDISIEYNKMKQAGEKTEESNPKRNEIIKILEELKESLDIKDGITFARQPDGEDR